MLNQVQSPNYSSILASFAILCSVQRFRKRSEKFFELHNVNRLCDDSPDSPYTGEQYFVRMCDASSVWHNVWCALKSAVTN